MDKQGKNSMAIFNDAIKKVERQERIEAFKAMREMYLDMTEAGFTMREAMTLIASICIQSQKNNEEE